MNWEFNLSGLKLLWLPGRKIDFLKGGNRYVLTSSCRMDSRKPQLSYVVLPAERTESPIVTTDLRIDECMKTKKLPGY